MSTLLLDASTLLAVFDAGPSRAAARALLAHECVALDQALTEVARIVHGRRVRGEAGEAAALATLDALPHVCRFLGTTPALVRRGLEIGFTLGLGPTDGLWLAATESLDATLVTADAVLFQRTRGTAYDARVALIGGLPI